MDTETQVDKMQSHHMMNSSMSMSMSMKYHYLLKRSLQLAITLSLFSLLICLSTINSNSRSSYVVVYLNPLFLSSFFTHTLERKYMFLICNAILAFLATTSTRKTTSSSAFDHHDYDEDVDLVGCESTHQDAAMFEGDTEEEEETEESGELGEGDEDDDHGSNDNDGDEDGSKYNDEIEEEGKEEGSLEMEEEEEGGKSSEEMVGHCSTEELNRKIEDFIRKMKQEMRIESQQPLVAAV